jgi:regulator of RNase E activity RraA
MPVTVSSDPVVRPSAELIAAYKGVAPATVGHLPGRRVMSAALKPGYRNCKIVGPAFTVRSPAPDNAAAYQACDLISPGDIMVIDRGGDVESACVGEFRGLAQKERGVAGWIIDGASTDILELEVIKFPVFARTWSARVGTAIGQSGAIQVPVLCGGVIVNPGDLIVADDNGIVVLSPAEAEELLPYCRGVEEREAVKRSDYMSKAFA